MQPAPLRGRNTNVCMWGGVPDTITPIKFDVNRFRRFRSLGCNNRGFPLTRRVALTTVLHYCADCDSQYQCGKFEVQSTVHSTQDRLARADVWIVNVLSYPVYTRYQNFCISKKEILTTYRLPLSAHMSTPVK